MTIATDRPRMLLRSFEHQVRIFGDNKHMTRTEMVECCYNMALILIHEDASNKRVAASRLQAIYQDMRGRLAMLTDE